MTIRTRETVDCHRTTPLVGTARSTTLRDAARLLHQSDIGAVVVRDQHGLIGLFAERDLVRAIARGDDPDVQTVGTSMSVPPITARPDDTVLDVALLMLESWIRHVPLVDAYGRERGMVSLRDLLRPLVLQAMTPPERLDTGAAPHRQSA